MFAKTSDSTPSCPLDEANEFARQCVVAVSFFRSSDPPSDMLVRWLFEAQGELSTVLPETTDAFRLAASRICKTRLGDVRRLGSWHETALNEAGKAIEALRLPDGRVVGAVESQADGSVRINRDVLNESWPLIRSALAKLPKIESQEFRETLNDEWLQATNDAIQNTSAESPQYVRLDQMAAVVNRSKRTLERLKTLGELPVPDVDGGGGMPDEWIWKTVRPILQAKYGKVLPERFPSSRQPHRH